MPDRLVEGVDLLMLDAGNTVIFLDHARIARFVNALGFSVDTETLVRTEGEAKTFLELPAAGDLVEVEWASRGRPGARGWGQVIGTAVHRAGVPRDRLPEILEKLWEDHVRWNLYSLVPEGLGDALDRVRAAGVKVAIISNSEGMLARLFEQLKISSHFDLIVDSGIFGVEKPDPRIFQVALDEFATPAGKALHLGDTYATDVLGAQAAKVRTALIDPHGHYTGRFADIPRVAGVVEVVRAMLASRDGIV
ncbi:MAG: HAD-IA family hydrolase [Polyangiaceae bacterium]